MSNSVKRNLGEKCHACKHSCPSSSKYFIVESKKQRQRKTAMEQLFTAFCWQHSYQWTSLCSTVGRSHNVCNRWSVAARHVPVVVVVDLLLRSSIKPAPFFSLCNRAACRGPYIPEGRKRETCLNRPGVSEGSSLLRCLSSFLLKARHPFSGEGAFNSECSSYYKKDHCAIAAPPANDRSFLCR